MAKMDKESEARLQGMRYALTYAKEKDIEELEKEVKRRGYCGISIRYTDTQIINTVREISENTYTMMLTAFLYALHEEFGFGIERLKRTKHAVNKLVDNTFDLDYMGQHYISMTDYADELCEKYPGLVDLTRVMRLQESFDKKDEGIKTCKVDRVLEVLRNEGLNEAADFLEAKIS